MPSSEKDRAKALASTEIVEKQRNSIADWILSQGRFSEPAPFVDALCRRLVARAIHIDRALVSLLLIHPRIRATGYRWRPETGSEEVQLSHDVAYDPSYLASPIKRIHDGADFLRAKLIGKGASREMPFYDELRTEGMTDYAIFALPFGDGTRNAFSIATRSDQGFSDADLGLVRELLPLVAMSIEIQTGRRTAEVLLDTYVGRAAGQKILNGVIRRGHGERIRAVIWCSDLRGFTAFSDLRSTREVIGTLNEFFDALAQPIEAHHGQILKFIGDGVLAIFPLEDAAFDYVTCRGALDAAIESRDTMAALNLRRERSGQPPLRHCVALHIGDIVYGNIGAAERLDFTAIGPAVNLASRLEGLAKQLDAEIVFSEAFAAIARTMRPVVSLGRHPLKGLLAAPEVFTVAELDPARRASAPAPAMAQPD